MPTSTSTSDITSPSIASFPPATSIAFPHPSPRCTCTTQLLQIFHELRALTTLVSSTRTSVATDGTTSDLIYLTERHLIVLYKESKDFPPSSSHTSVCTTSNQSSILAALIYLCISLRDLPSEAPLFDMFLARLSSALFCGARLGR